MSTTSPLKTPQPICYRQDSGATPLSRRLATQLRHESSKYLPHCEPRRHQVGAPPAIYPQFIVTIIVLALIGDQLECGDNICGAVLSIRFNEDILIVWNRNASDHQAVMALRDSIKRHLKLPHSYVMEYKAHDASQRDNSSYRNTWLRG